ncbi:hypothetical protein FS749_008737, partial [Ceratobasidium sp. UAMH 11750]
MLNRMHTLSNAIQSKSYFALRVCSALDPENPLSAQFVLEELQRVLVTEFDGFENLQDAFKKSLWLSDFGIFLCTQLRPLAGAAARTAYEKHNLSIPARALLSTVSDELDIKNKNDYEQVFSVCLQEQLAARIKPPTAFRAYFLPLVWKLPLGTRVMRLFGRPAMNVSRAAGAASQVDGGRALEELHSTIKTLATKSRLGPTYYLDLIDLGLGSEGTISRIMSHGSANAVLDRLESMGLSNPSNVVNLCRILEHSKDRSCWEYSIEALLSDTLEPAVKADATRDTILLVNP